MMCSTVSSCFGDLAQQRRKVSSTMMTLSFGVIDDERELLGKEADVEGVHDRAHRRDREVRLEVLLAVPAERAYAILALDPELGERVGELVDTVTHLRIGADPVATLRRP